MNVTLELAVSALIIWCQKLRRSGELSPEREVQLDKLLRDIDRISRENIPGRGR